MLLLLVPAALLRTILKKPLSRIYALLIAFVLLVLFTLSLDGIIGQPICAAAAVISYYALRSDRRTGQAASISSPSEQKNPASSVRILKQINSLTLSKPFSAKLTDVLRRHKFALAIWLFMMTTLALCPPCREECDVYTSFNQELLWSYAIPLNHQFIWKVDTGRVVGPSEQAVNMEIVQEFAREKNISSIKAGDQFKAKAISIRSSGEIYNPFTVDACIVRINWFLMFWYFAGISCFALILAGILEAIRYRQN